MALEITRISFDPRLGSRYVAEVRLSRFYYRCPHSYTRFTEYRYRFNDSLLYDELRHEDLTKKRYRELCSLIRSRAQFIMRDNDTDFQPR